MKVAGDYEVLEAVALEMDPIADGFGGVLIELARTGDRYVLTETASVTGNRVFRFSSASGELARALFDRELREAGNGPAA